MTTGLRQICLAATDTVRAAIAAIDAGRKHIALVLDATGRLIGTITDGDIRRAMLESPVLDRAVTELLARKTERYARPITAPLGTTPAQILHLMREHAIQQIPLLDPTGRVAGLVTMDDLLPEGELALQAVIMAGGFGTRLLPLTEETPKPMLTVGDRPLLEHTIEQLRVAGIRRVNVTTHYLPEKITEHFGDGAAFGVELSYVSEEKPLGTGGALGLIERPTEPILVINGDILTRLDYRAMLAFHREHGAALTIAVRHFNMKIPYGVVESSDGNVTGLREKPTLPFTVNAGIYLLEPSVYEFIESGERFDMTDLIHRLLDAKRVVSSFLIHEYWLDIGKHDDYERAQRDVQHFNK